MSDSLQKIIDYIIDEITHYKLHKEFEMVEILSALKDRLEALQKQPAAYMTHHDEPMLFLTEQEAASYCEDDEKPNPLIRGD